MKKNRNIDKSPAWDYYNKYISVPLVAVFILAIIFIFVFDLRVYQENRRMPSGSHSGSCLSVELGGTGDYFECIFVTASQTITILCRADNETCDNITDDTPWCAERECENDPECQEQYNTMPYCREGLCVECKTDDHCENEYCVNNQCVACKDDSHCFDPRFDYCYNSNCVQCREHSHCDFGEGIFCKNNFCSECLTHDDCKVAPLLYCHGLYCVECVEDSHCEDPTPKCSTFLGKCVECTEHTHCNPPLPLCFFRLGKCVECSEDNDCVGQNPFCHSSLNVCVECREHEHCPTDHWCDPETGFCYTIV